MKNKHFYSISLIIPKNVKNCHNSETIKNFESLIATGFIRKTIIKSYTKKERIIYISKFFPEKDYFTNNFFYGTFTVWLDRFKDLVEFSYN